jgi:hypothetical protein
MVVQEGRTVANRQYVVEQEFERDRPVYLIGKGCGLVIWYREVQGNSAESFKRANKEPQLAEEEK